MTDFDANETTERQAEMIMSPTIGNLAAALALAQGKFTHPPKDRAVKVRGETKAGRDFEYTFHYATLDAVMKVVRQPLAENGLAIVQMVLPIRDKHKLRTILLHASGEFLGCEVPLLLGDTDTRKNLNQVFGSALTYMRRYTITSLLGIVADEDDDANTADGNQATPVSKQQVTRPVPQSAPAAPAKGTVAPAAAAAHTPNTAAAAAPQPEDENPAPVEFREAPGRVETPPPAPKPAPAAQAAPKGPVDKNSPEFKKGLADFTAIKQKFAAATTAGQITELLGQWKPRLDEIADLSPDAGKAVAEMLTRLDARAKQLPDA